MRTSTPKSNIHVVMLLDIICEWCCLGKYMLDSLRDNYDFALDYLFMEIHPDAPVHGMPMSWHLEEPKKFYDTLNSIGEPYGIHFMEKDIFSNTHSALRVAEYALNKGKAEAFLNQIWDLYMFKGENISDSNVILQALLQAGLPPIALDKALTEPIWEQKLIENAKTNDLVGLNGNVPGFIVNGKYVLSGAQPKEVWEEVFELCMHEMPCNDRHNH